MRLSIEYFGLFLLFATLVGAIFFSLPGAVVIAELIVSALASSALMVAAVALPAGFGLPKRYGVACAIGSMICFVIFINILATTPIANSVMIGH